VLAPIIVVSTWRVGMAAPVFPSSNWAVSHSEAAKPVLDEKRPPTEAALGLYWRHANLTADTKKCPALIWNHLHSKAWWH
jgi:hypothetical protein